MDNSKKKDEYINIFEYLKIKYININNISALIDFIYNENESIYIVEKELFNSVTYDIRNLENKLSINFIKDENLDIEKTLTNLNDL
ncbi:MAG: hypothetical protein U9Q66_02000 [Patescibacteria group bacterium]|nr:hypothetical protein [Patescibacteria group bacterium]